MALLLWGDEELPVTESHSSPHPHRLRTTLPHRTSPAPSAKGQVGMEMFHISGSLSGTPGPRSHRLEEKKIQVFVHLAAVVKIGNLILSLPMASHVHLQNPHSYPRSPASLLWPQLATLPSCLPALMVQGPHALFLEVTVHLALYLFSPLYSGIQLQQG